MFYVSMLLESTHKKQIQLDIVLDNNKIKLFYVSSFAWWKTKSQIV